MVDYVGKRWYVVDDVASTGMWWMTSPSLVCGGWRGKHWYVVEDVASTGMW